MNYEIGHEVEVYIPRGDNPDHRYHGHQGTVIDILEDDLSELTDTPGRGKIYTVEFDEPGQEQADFRYSDLEPQK